MYTKELKYMIIDYSDKDLDYIDNICEYIRQSCDEIISFLGIEEFGEKVKVKLWNNFAEFIEFFKTQNYEFNSDEDVYDWICGFADGTAVHTLCLEEYRKTKSHENSTLQDLNYLIMHEFTHCCQDKINTNSYAWLCEGLATTITHQRENDERIFNFTLEQIMYGGPDYRNYHTMFAYVYETYGRDYILELIKDYDLLQKITPKLYKETVEMYGNKDKVTN